MAERLPVLELRTGDGVRFSLPLAGPIVRLLAWVIDLLAVSVLTSFLSRLLTAVVAVSEDVGSAVQLLAFFVVFQGYSIAFEWFMRGQTIGKRLFGLRVVDAEGRRLRPEQVVVRNVLRFADMLPIAYLVGGVSCFLTRRAQRLGDIAAGTVVIRTESPSIPMLDRVITGARNSLADHPRLAARLRHRVLPEEAALALDAVLRRDRLEPAARVALFAELAAHFRGIVPFPEAATEGLSDERYVQNVTALLFTEAAKGKGRVHGSA